MKEIFKGLGFVASGAVIGALLLVIAIMLGIL